MITLSVGFNGRIDEFRHSSGRSCIREWRNKRGGTFEEIITEDVPELKELESLDPKYIQVLRRINQINPHLDTVQ